MSSIGSVLAEARRDQGKTLKEVERATRIRSRYIQALEDEDFGSLPGSSYARAFIREYAQFLGIDGQPLVASFNEKHQASKREQHIDSAVVMPMRRRSHRAMSRSRPSRALAVVVIAIAAVLLLLVFTLFKGNNSDERRTQVVGVEASNTKRPAPAAGSGSDAANVNLTVQVTEPAGCWVRVTSDGKTVFEGVLAYKDKKSWSADKELALRAGDAGSLTISINGGPAKSAGSKNSIFEETFDKRSE